MGGRNCYHICNQSQRIIFRTEEDHIFAITRLAICAEATQIDVFAFSIMSTHFHLILRGEVENIRNFIKLFSRGLLKIALL